jgi:hypothetical protein
MFKPANYSGLTYPYYYQLALKPFVGPGLLHQQPPSISVPRSGPPIFNLQHPKVFSDIIKPPQFWSTSYSLNIDLLMQDFPWHSVTIHSFYVSQPIDSSCLYKSKYTFFLQYLIYFFIVSYSPLLFLFYWHIYFPNNFSIKTPTSDSYMLVRNKKTNSVALVRKRTIPTERPPLSA